MTDKTRKRITRWFWVLFSVPVAMVMLLIGLVWAFADIPSFEELENPDSKLATQVIAEDGEVLTTFHIENRSFVSYEELSPNLVNAAVATEDSRFYRHSGIDFESLAEFSSRPCSEEAPAREEEVPSPSSLPRPCIRERIWEVRYSRWSGPSSRNG